MKHPEGVSVLIFQRMGGGLKALVIPMIALVMMLIATLPLVIFGHASKLGIGLRLNSGLICLWALSKFGSQFNEPGGKAGAFMAFFAVAYSYVFLFQTMKRKGLPIVETALGCLVFAWVNEALQSPPLAMSFAVASIVALYVWFTKKHPVVSTRN
ncbi:hypothetical protein [Blastomonas sp.]|uniref:hypothetical protein n=1 Tax=Blastomonas sp. TaxID=1909299 RepID=UPI003593C127